MADATHMQLRRGRRALALLLASCVVLSGLFVLRHETTVAHVRGALSGELEHAHALAGFHQLSTTPHLHGRDDGAHAEAGVCSLLAALDHGSLLPASSAACTAHQPAAILAIAIVPADPPARALFRLAPKTSPPATV